MRRPCYLPLMLVLSCLFLLHAASAAAAAGGNRKALLPREALAVDVSGEQAVPTTAEEAAVGGELPPLADEEMVRRVDLQTEDYPGSGANGRHDPRNPH